MTNSDRLLARRSLIKGAGLGLVAGALAPAINRQLFWHVARAFLSMPAPIAT